MPEPIRNPANTVISVSMSRALLNDIDARAKALGLSRSQYLCQLAREDLIARGDMTLREKPEGKKTVPLDVASVTAPIRYFKQDRK